MIFPMRLGLTGGIGSGKSTVAHLLVTRHGATLIDTDAIARETTQPGGAAMPAIEACFGTSVTMADGGLNRERMRELAFNDPQAKQALEAIVHPLIGKICTERALAAHAPLIVFDVPLLAESQRWRHMVDRILVVDAQESTQVARVMARSGWPADTVRAVIRQQASRVQRNAVADALICNDALTLDELANEVRAFWKTLNLPA